MFKKSSDRVLIGIIVGFVVIFIGWLSVQKYFELRAIGVPTGDAFISLLFTFMVSLFIIGLGLTLVLLYAIPEGKMIYYVGCKIFD